jgi:hypothetical protein
MEDETLNLRLTLTQRISKQQGLPMMPPIVKNSQTKQ